jgi:hypothetical protein
MDFSDRPFHVIAQDLPEIKLVGQCGIICGPYETPDEAIA